MSKTRQLLNKAREAKKKAVDLYGDLEIVNGIGISKTEGEYAVKINLVEELDDESNWLQEIDGTKVLYCVIGKIKKQKLEN